MCRRTCRAVGRSAGRSAGRAVGRSAVGVVAAQERTRGNDFYYPFIPPRIKRLGAEHSSVGVTRI